jgi:ubiquinone/menaquinone biosynthesis C-methylase UbiE
MANRLEAAAHLAGQTIRTGWYAALYGLTNSRISRLGRDGNPIRLTRPVPNMAALLQGVLTLQAQDADNVRRGLYPAPAEDDGSVAEHLAAVRRMFEDLPRSNARRQAGAGDEAKALPEAEGLPEYYAQNFHFQSGGWLTSDSARIYDVQVETLFMGSAGAMRRQAIPPIQAYLSGHDQRQFRLADIACGSGRFLGQLAQAFPAMPMTGVDLSQPYLDEAARHLEGRRNIDFRRANAEALPFPDASLDIVTNVYLFHELPHDVRRTVTAEVARVLKPGGLFVFVDSLQWGDVPEYEALLEAFPQRFHEPYYLDYLEDDLAGPDGVFARSGLAVTQVSLPFLSKVVVCRKALR